MQIEKLADDREKYCSGKPIRHFISLVIREIFTSILAYIIISCIVAFILSLLNATILRNGKYCLPHLSELLDGTNGYKCTLADFNFISIKGMLDITIVYSPELYVCSPVGIRPIVGLYYNYSVDKEV